LLVKPPDDGRGVILRDVEAAEPSPPPDPWPGRFEVVAAACVLTSALAVVLAVATAATQRGGSGLPSRIALLNRAGTLTGGANVVVASLLVLAALLVLGPRSWSEDGPSSRVGPLLRATAAVAAASWLVGVVVVAVYLRYPHGASSSIGGFHRDDLAQLLQRLTTPATSLVLTAAVAWITWTSERDAA
jgi:hypothetical protein